MRISKVTDYAALSVVYTINKVKKKKGNTHTIGSPMDSCIDEASQVQTGRDISTIHLFS